MLLRSMFLIGILVLVSCASTREFPYAIELSNETSQLTIEDTYADNFVGVPLFFNYYSEAHVYDSNQECPFKTDMVYNHSELPGYLGSLKLSKKEPSKTIYIEPSRPKYLDVFRLKDTPMGSEYCSISYRLDIKNDTNYHLKFDGNRCIASLYEISNEGGELKRIDLAQGESSDERLCR